MDNSRAHEANNADRGLSVLYVLTASLALVAIGMIAVAVAAQLFQ